MDLHQLIERSERPLISVAHQDDELGYSGLIQRIGPKARFFFMTNGDGLAPGLGEDPIKYAEMRKAECVNALGSLGIPADHVRCLDFSEIEIYAHMARFTDEPGRAREAIEFFGRIRTALSEAVAALKPDLVFLAAFQGGHPEHDLSHFFTALALGDLARRTGEEVPLFHFPEYELTILLPMRFRPWYPGNRITLRLTEEEMENKLAMAAHYPSQEGLFRKFEMVANTLTLPFRLTRRGKGGRSFFSKEVISQVPADFDYSRPPYTIDFFNYMFEDFEGTPISFKRCIQPIVGHFLAKEKEA